MNLHGQELKAVQETVDLVVSGGAKRAVKYLSPTRTVKATARHKHGSKDSAVVVVVTIGVPNYAESKYIKLLKKAEEPFPVKKLRVKWF